MSADLPPCRPAEMKSGPISLNAAPAQTSSASEFTRLLAVRFGAASNPKKRDMALDQLLCCIALASAELTEIFNYGLSVDEFERVVRKRLGLASLRQISEIVAKIGKPILEDDCRRSQASPIKSKDAGDSIKEDLIYHVVMMPALGLFYNLHEQVPNLMTGRDIRSGNVVTSLEKQAIKALRPLPEGRKQWAKLIVQLTSSGNYWANRAAMESGGKLYEEIAERAGRNRRGKATQAFQERYAVQGDGKPRGISPREFLQLSSEKKNGVIDRSKRADNEPLDTAKIARVTKRAAKIEAMPPTPPELKRELTAIVSDRLKTLPRNRPQV